MVISSSLLLALLIVGPKVDNDDSFTTLTRQLKAANAQERIKLADHVADCRFFATKDKVELLLELMETTDDYVVYRLQQCIANMQPDPGDLLISAIDKRNLKRTRLILETFGHLDSPHKKLAGASIALLRQKELSVEDHRVIRKTLSKIGPLAVPEISKALGSHDDKADETLLDALKNCLLQDDDHENSVEIATVVQYCCESKSRDFRRHGLHLLQRVAVRGPFATRLIEHFGQSKEPEDLMDACIAIQRAGVVSPLSEKHLKKMLELNDLEVMYVAIETIGSLGTKEKYVTHLLDLGKKKLSAALKERIVFTLSSCKPTAEIEDYFKETLIQARKAEDVNIGAICALTLLKTNRENHELVDYLESAIGKLSDETFGILKIRLEGIESVNMRILHSIRRREMGMFHSMQIGALRTLGE